MAKAEPLEVEIRLDLSGFMDAVAEAFLAVVQYLTDTIGPWLPFAQAMERIQAITGQDQRTVVTELLRRAAGPLGGPEAACALAEALEKDARAGRWPLEALDG